MKRIGLCLVFLVLIGGVGIVVADDNVEGNGAEVTVENGTLQIDSIETEGFYLENGDNRLKYTENGSGGFYVENRILPDEHRITFVGEPSVDDTADWYISELNASTNAGSNGRYVRVTNETENTTAVSLDHYHDGPIVSLESNNRTNVTLGPGVSGFTTNRSPTDIMEWSVNSVDEDGSTIVIGDLDPNRPVTMYNTNDIPIATSNSNSDGSAEFSMDESVNGYIEYGNTSTFGNMSASPLFQEETLDNFEGIPIHIKNKNSDTEKPPETVNMSLNVDWASFGSSYDENNTNHSEDISTDVTHTEYISVNESMMTSDNEIIEVQLTNNNESGTLYIEVNKESSEGGFTARNFSIFGIQIPIPFVVMFISVLVVLSTTVFWVIVDPLENDNLWY